MTDDEWQQKIFDLLAETDREELTLRLLGYAGSYWRSKTGSVASNAVRRELVRQAVEALLTRGSNYAPWFEWQTCFQLACGVIRHRIDQYHQAVDAIVNKTNWDQLSTRLIALTLRTYGPQTSRHGRSAQDYVSEAIETILGRRRYFPFDRVKLFTFLWQVIRSLHAHEAEKLMGEGAHVTLVPKRTKDLLPRELAEGDLVAPTLDQDERAALLIARDFIFSIEDERLRRYAELRAIGYCETAAEYAELLGVTEQMIRNWDRQLRRRRDRWNQGL